MPLTGSSYETLDEISFRLNNTVVLYENKPVYITKIAGPAETEDEIARVYFHELPLGGAVKRETRKFLSSRKFDLRPFRMGYMNFKSEAVFLSRTPIRQNRQGLGADNVLLYDFKGELKNNLSFRDVLYSKGFVDMVKNLYPDFPKARDLLKNNDATSVAVNRAFSFVKDDQLDVCVLLYKNSKCGLLLDDEKGVRVPPKFHFLRNEMEEHYIPIY